MTPKARHAQQTRILKNWGDTPIGSPVTVEKDDGSRVETITTSDAWMLGGHTAVIMLRGISGCYALDRVTKLRPKP